MKAGIIAAGLGSRLARGGINVPKPLVVVGGETLAARALERAAAAGAQRAAVITTPIFPEVTEYLRRGAWPLPLDLVVWESPNSLESLLALEPYLRDAEFVLQTVDAVFAPGALADFVSQARKARGPGALGLTTFQDDESPLYVEVGVDMKITSVGQPRVSPYITAGCYFFRPEVFDWRNKARALGLKALREFLTLLATNGYPLLGIDVGPAVDVDHPGDIRRAELLLETGNLS
ncbi:MAG: NTP transferase domain-containing protein [Deltaproteobacteria bacterium]|jgi:NDP-sugar pyrophosphorylase family protein